MQRGQRLRVATCELKLRTCERDGAARISDHRLRAVQ